MKLFIEAERLQFQMELIMIDILFKLPAVIGWICFTLCICAGLKLILGLIWPPSSLQKVPVRF